ncbi:ECF RNA polymerase sigma factor SigK [Streptomyces sp. DSM 42041]|uniref:ECF RNA polymerase sigma factor SigK n=1 Tax=Streptomyces hazeniae TaxID=3075538 RepID=A0ABU2P108_9ACTN|nr:ECF RNA polymerase sigma factor SigK [Streptomyces sp. DSM 42041]MDT0382699.1 ECF RNA polymerase sigma factor SigK [Streptomyces sp. DSM 42041]
MRANKNSTSARPAGESLDALLTRVGRGETEAFDALYHAVAGRILGLAHKVLRDTAHAEEVCQDVLVQLWRTAPRFDPHRGSALTWILTMTHRRAVDRVRSTQAATHRDKLAGLRDHPVAYDQVAEAVALREEQAAIRHCLDALTPRQRESITMAYYQAHTYPEVAQKLGLALGTVKSRIRDGLFRLRDCLATT